MQAAKRQNLPHRPRRTRRLLSAGAFLTTILPLGAASADIVLDLPVRCDFGTTCSIQNYVDHDPGPGRMDYACGRLSYDRHDGTDIRVPDIPTMAAGVPVVAAAPGIVKAIRDSMPDISVKTIGRAALAGRYAGNGVLLSHGHGWETQYSHLKRGSVAVRPGQTVRAGDLLGLIGLSGNTEFPHVHFEIRHNGRSIDPFVGPIRFDDCRDARSPLWSPAALQRLPYRATGPLIAGFSTARPDKTKAQHGDYATESLTRESRALVLWVELYGVMKGDVETFKIEGPHGATIHHRKHSLKKSFVDRFVFSGRKAPNEGWAPGSYAGIYTLERDGNIIVTMRRTVSVR